MIILVNDDETLVFQLQEDIYNLLSDDPEYSGLVVKATYEDFPKISYPIVLLYEIENSAVSKFYDLQEHVINVSYQFIIMCEDTETRSATDNVRNIITRIRDYMRGEKYHALKRLGNTPITTKHDDENVRIGYMRYVGQIDIDTHTIYRRN